jgi:HK97 family phage major capsid protein
MKNSVELRKDIAKLVHDAREITNRAGDEPTAEDQSQVDQIMAKVDDLTSRVEQLEKLESAEEDLEDAPEEQNSSPRSKFLLAEPETRGDNRRHASTQYRKAFANYLKTGETRDLSVGTGGTDYLAPVEFSKQFIIALNNLVFIRQMATVETLGSAVSLRVRTLGTDLSDADWTAEIPDSFTPDSAMAISHIDLTPALLAKLIKVSHQMMKQASDIETLINSRMVYKFAVACENAYLTGSGSGEPLGVFTASSSGIPTSQDVNIGATVTSDAIYDTTYSLAQQYTKSKTCAWVMHRSLAKTIRLLKDSLNRYLWEPSLVIGQPETLDSHPLYYSEYAPSALTNGSYTWVFGDFSYYTVTELGDLEVQRLNERYADTSEIGFLGRYYGSGGPVLAQAFARGQIVTS